MFVLLLFSTSFFLLFLLRIPGIFCQKKKNLAKFVFVFRYCPAFSDDEWWWSFISVYKYVCKLGRIDGDCAFRNFLKLLLLLLYIMHLSFEQCVRMSNAYCSCLQLFATVCKRMCSLANPITNENQMAEGSTNSLHYVNSICFPFYMESFRKILLDQQIFFECKWYIVCPKR